MDSFPKSESVDIMLLLEGTFPYVRGGVSNWVNQIIIAFPEYRFGALFIGSARNDYGGLKYDLPPNLVHVECHYLHDELAMPAIGSMTGNHGVFETVRRIHDWFLNPDPSTLDSALKTPDFYLDSDNGANFDQFLYSKKSWELICDLYQERCNDPSFVDYFWTVRNMHTPIWMLASIAKQLIPARVYHTVSTGYAGFLGALLHYSSGRPLILSEHGIYTKERRIDIFSSDWIQDNRNALQKDPTEVSYYRDLWIRFFETIGRFCYGAADNIVSLYEEAREREIGDGAPRERTMVVPNGINIAQFATLRERRPDTPPVLTLLGRVVPIKDIKTFIRALRLVANSLPEVQGWIIGPEDEDPEYAAECRALAESLQIASNLSFMGFRNPMEIFPDTGVMILSSVSEGLPLAILEAFAAGIPVVATDVGACRQLIMGHGQEDEAIGPAGGVVSINNPHDLARETLRLLEDPARWKRASQAAITRVERFYTEQQMFDRYRQLYQQGID
ncbi:GT4 family glycosyltransferase PelF [Geobacter sp.]|uniref:GT4 family glycosyltransferase PelF n=1 Tax=Geobacter sp. TaxID=46610 RepID=UPI001AD5C24B|nr:GT4 family glycosyltransferase PelF [Geobacter sp.]CAG0961845.1 polysaccharide biosynthesis protein PelF [Geobacteraceae bacterium]